MARKNKGKKNAKQSEPAKQQTSQPSNSSVSTFSDVVLQSKDRIETVSVDTNKRRVGRPRKNESESAPPKADSIRENNAPTGEPSKPVEQPVEKVDITPYLVLPLQVASMWPAHRYKVAELKLTDEEALACAQALQAIMDAYVPAVATTDPKTAALIQASTTFGAIAFSKYMIYLQKRIDTQPDQAKTEEKKDSVPNQVTPNQVFETMNVGPRPA